MISDTTIYDASLFTGAAVLLTLVAFLFGSARRRGLVPMVAIAAAGLLGLWLAQRYETLFESKIAADIAREGALALIAIGFARVLILFVFQTLFARRGIPRILDDFVIALVLVGYTIYRLHSIGVNLAGLITTSAVLTGALAFSAQETLGNLWGGIALQVEKTCRIGDWIRIDDHVGQVVQIRWRYMAIATNSNETIVIPNSAVMKNRLVLLARRGEERAKYRRAVPFEIDLEQAPSRVIARIDEAFERAEIPNMATDPKPFVVCEKFDENAIEYALMYHIIDLRRDLWTDSEVRAHLYAAIKRAGFTIPFPHRVVEMRDERSESAEKDRVARLKAINDSDLFASLTENERSSLAAELHPCFYAGDDVVFRAGEAADSLYLLAQGRVQIAREDGGRARQKLATLSAPSYFGEMGLLLGQARLATVVVDGEAQCYRLDKGGFDAILQARPELAEMLAKVLAARQAANDATMQALDAEARARQQSGRATELVRRIQSFFGLRS
jgi:small-conductance mechanosensitive channel/CRP-like cAMP-binding protein